MTPGSFKAPLSLKPPRRPTLVSGRKVARPNLFFFRKSIIRFAVEGTPFADLAKHLDGTTAFALSEEDAVAPARIIAKYSKDVKNGFDVKAGFVEGEILDVAGVAELSAIPSREVLIAQVLGGFNGVIRNFAVVLDQIREQKEAC